jgi:protein-S-isoprenylcysteine O-methyltransferase Ste14
LNREHWVLLLAWGLFGLLHSLMATSWCKRFFGRWLGRNKVYYRLAYSLVAFVSLGAVVAIQFSIKSFYLTAFPFLKYFVGLLIGLPGVMLMIVCIRKYFFQLSGVKVFFETEQGAKLESGGIHTYVRHPLYLGTLAMIWSLFFFFPLLSNLLACIAITVYTLIGIRLEERKLLLFFGDQYAAYCRRTPMLIPNFRLR